MARVRESGQQFESICSSYALRLSRSTLTPTLSLTGRGSERKLLFEAPLLQGDHAGVSTHSFEARFPIHPLPDLRRVAHAPRACSRCAARMGKLVASAEPF